MRYYGGAEGKVLVQHPTLGLTTVVKQRPPKKDDTDNGGKEEGQGGGGGEDGGDDDSDGITVQLPPPGTLTFHSNK
jgi:hypothetical protein